MAVPQVLPVPSQKTIINSNALEPQGRTEGGQRVKSQNGEVLNSSISENQENNSHPSVSAELVALITREAHRVKLLPADLWAFLSVDDIEALQTGSREEGAALRAFAESVSRTGDRTNGGHDWPFPGLPEPSEGFKLVCCGDRASFEPDTIGDGRGIGRCRKNLTPRGGAKYPGTMRVCRGFAARREG